MKNSSRFRHESLQDRDSIKRLLNSLTSGIAKGKVVLEDEDGTMTMDLSGLTNLKISASQDDRKNRINIRLTWYEEPEPVLRKEIQIHSK